MRFIAELGGDLRFALRQMSGQPAFAAVAVVTLAIGIGVNSAIFALVDATLLRPLPLPDSDRLVMIWESNRTTPKGRVSPLNLLDYAERNHTFDVVTAYLPNIGGMVMSGGSGLPENVSRQWLPSAAIFEALGVTAIAGRTFRASDAITRANVVVLSERFWRTRFGADPEMVGRDVRLDGDLFTVIGVVPENAQLIGAADVWALRTFNRDPNLRSPRVLLGVGRLKPGATLEEAMADLNGIATSLAQEYPDANAGLAVTIESLRDALVGSDLRRTSLLFVGVVSFVLLICCANVANLLLARATVRDRELAIRAALGARPGRVIKQLLTESLLLASFGAGLGLALGAGILSAAPRFLPPGLLPNAVRPAFDLRVVLFASAAAAVVGIIFGLAPAWRSTKSSAPRPNTTDRRTTTAGGTALRNALVMGEVATSLLLVLGAGLLLRTLLAVENVDRGYGAGDALTMTVDPMASSYPTPAVLKGFFDDVEREIRAIPGVHSVAWASTLPLGPSYAGSYAFGVVGDAPQGVGDRPTADLQIVSSTYFSTLALPILAGREFTEHDTRETVAVCIVNEAFARTQLPGRSPIGARIALRPAGAPGAKPVVREIIGVARQVKGRPDETSDFLQVYVPMTQVIMDDIFLVVRSAAGDPALLAPAVRAAISRVDKAQLVGVRDVRTLNDIVAAATSRHRFRAVLVVTFAAVALLLAMVGVFGTLAYSVQQRVREFGLRIALGASGASVLRLVLSNALRVIGAGIVIGLVLAALLSRLLTGMLFGVEPLDAATFVVATSALTITALLSTLAPALRATRADPAQSLRAE